MLFLRSLFDNSVLLAVFLAGTRPSFGGNGLAVGFVSHLTEEDRQVMAHLLRQRGRYAKVCWNALLVLPTTLTRTNPRFSKTRLLYINFKAIGIW